MNILVIGNGGREHAIIWKLSRSGHRLLCAPGNPGIAQHARCLNIQPGDLEAIERAALAHRLDLVVVGPEAPLVAGLADRLRARGVPTFGPGAAGASLEGSKLSCKQFLVDNDIRTAPFFACRDVDAAERAIEEIAALGTGVVVKADGLAGGKGVIVCADADRARRCTREVLCGGRFGDAGARLVVEQKLSGRELSVMAVTDGTSFQTLATVEDHKAIFDGDRGPNTGGMGAVSPCGWVTPALMQRIERDVLQPTMRGFRAQGLDYRGLLYAGLMIDESLDPWVLEYNCRFGDPETQAILPRLHGDLADWLAGAAHGQLPDVPMAWDPRTCVCVILASAGYPDSPHTGRPIHGFSGARGGVSPTVDGDTVVFHAGTAVRDGVLVTAGGRVFGVTSLGRDTAEARRAAYDTIERISFDGMQFRRDIGARPDDMPDDMFDTEHA